MAIDRVDQALDDVEILLEDLKQIWILIYKTTEITDRITDLEYISGDSPVLTDTDFESRSNLKHLDAAALQALLPLLATMKTNVIGTDADRSNRVIFNKALFGG